MKVHPSIRAMFDEQTRLNTHLKARVDKTLSGLRDNAWHFESRLKGEESFAIKVESGLSADPNRLEDFLAGVLVVPSLADVAAAEARLRRVFDVVERRPRVPGSTSKSANAFPFDDLRLYLRYSADDSRPPQESDDVVFELQVRTFLQHAWTVSTHDTVYKSDSVSWPRERVAHQVKAMLEHAELAVSSLANLEVDPTMPTSAKYDDTNALIAVLRRHWRPHSLPQDMKRIAAAIYDIGASTLDLDLSGIERVLEEGRRRYGGAHNSDWSPVRAFTEYLADQSPKELRRYIRAKKSPRKIVLHEETLVKLGVRKQDAHAAIIIYAPMP